MSEPLFTAVAAGDKEMKDAHAKAAGTIQDFIRLVATATEEQCMAKLSFKDPKLSEELGTDQPIFLWLAEVVYHSDEEIFSGVFFEVPDELKEWHTVGQRLGFDPEDVFDWMVLRDGHLKGGFTIRVTRSRLNDDQERAEYDEYIGVTSYEAYG